MEQEAWIDFERYYNEYFSILLDFNISVRINELDQTF